MTSSKLRSINFFNSKLSIKFFFFNCEKELFTVLMSFPGAQWVKNLPSGDPGLNPGLGRSPGEGNSNSLQYSCLENPIDRGAWWDIVRGVTRVGLDLGPKPPPPC